MNMYYTSSRTVLCYLWRSKPFARANIKGNPEYTALKGHVEFYTVNDGIVMTWNIHGLPDKTLADKQGIFHFHIYEEDDSCYEDHISLSEVGTIDGNETVFSLYNRSLPPLLSKNGYSFGTSFINISSQKDLTKKIIEVYAETDKQKKEYCSIKIGSGVIEKL